jgi:hypothetical protein
MVIKALPCYLQGMKIYTLKCAIVKNLDVKIPVNNNNNNNNNNIGQCTRTSESTNVRVQNMQHVK